MSRGGRLYDNTHFNVYNYGEIAKGGVSIPPTLVFFKNILHMH